MKKGLSALFAFLLLLTSALPVAVSAAPESAQDISGSTAYTGTGYDDFSFLKDQKTGTFKTSSGNATIRLENADGIGGLYLIFDLEYGAYTVTDNDTGTSVSAGQHSFLHEYLDLQALLGTLPRSVTLTFDKGKVRLSEITCYSQGTPPDSVQLWQAPLDGCADMVLFTSHGDDDQLFFAGLLPLYAGARGYAVQAVYLTDHRNLTNQRTHEILNGLWSVGIRAYPVMGSFADFRIDDLQQTYSNYASMGVSKDDLLKFVVTQVRRFKPQVAVGHDLKGEYGHGMHMMYADLLVKALDVSGDASVYPDIAEKYGVWDVPKTYLHLYGENTIEMDYDQPLDAFDGLTAFQVSQKLGYPCHKSQQYTWFTKWINGKETPITKATQIETYSPCKFGLYRTLVGADTGKNDMMENIVSYAEQARIAEEERLRQEEQQRLEEDKRQEELRRQQEEERARLEQEQKAAAAKKRMQIIGAVILLSALLIVLLIVVLRIINIARHKKRMARRRRRNGDKNNS